MSTHPEHSRIARAIAAALVTATLIACTGREDESVTPATVAEAVPEEMGVATPEPATTATDQVQATPLPEPANVAAMSNDPDQAALAAQAEAELLPPDAATETPSDTAPAPAPTAASGVNKAMAAHAAAASITERPAHTPVDMGAANAVQHPTPHEKVIRARRFEQLAATVALPTATINPQKPNQPVYVLKAAQIGISNFDDDARVYFAIKTKSENWRNESLLPDSVDEFDCGQGECLFWMRTGNHPPVTYKMLEKERYAIFWDDAKGMWDMGVNKSGGGSK